MCSSKVVYITGDCKIDVKLQCPHAFDSMVLQTVLRNVLIVIHSIYKKSMNAGLDILTIINADKSKQHCRKLFSICL